MNKENYSDVISQGIYLMTIGNYQAAKELFSQAKTAEPRQIAAYIHLGNAYVNMEKYDEGIKEFKNALLIEPENGALLYSIGSAYLLMDDRLKAIEYYNKAERAGFASVDMYQLLALTYFEANDAVQALRCINRAIGLNPLSGELRLFKARVYMADGHLEEALDTLDEMNKYLPDAFEAYDLRVDIFAGLGQNEEALKVAEAAFARFPDDAKIAAMRLKALGAAEKYDELLAAVELMKQNGQYDEALKLASMQEATAYTAKLELEKALDVLTQANKKLNNDEDVLFVALALAAKAAKHEMAVELSELLINTTKRDNYLATAQYQHAIALENSGKKDEAMAEYRKLVSIFRKATINNPSLYEVYILRLLCHTKLAEYDKALALADYLENANPESTDAPAFRHYIYKQQGDAEKAEEEKKKVLAINPDFVL